MQSLQSAAMKSSVEKIAAGRSSQDLAVLKAVGFTTQRRSDNLGVIDQGTGMGGVGVWSDKLHTLGFKVRTLLEQPGRLTAMGKNALRVAHPDAGTVVARFVTSEGAHQ